ncbi:MULTISPECIES: hypothetical protein [Saccharothrix]|uniref:hypothetical protein n=1 Tax=Saccharothrix TaxID=2071 RepID=UPI0027D26F54|nr:MULTISPECIES: hypothetical protein [Saccharothrix]MBY8849998.1 hypothetical protein [Saccharothrix sp. MB29]MDU0291216.1 hypothetical protein [Saccharothrix longispora]
MVVPSLRKVLAALALCAGLAVVVVAPTASASDAATADASKVFHPPYSAQP